ncbi:tetratricopeptide repeat protein [Sulfurimonas sp. HSL-1716]|uniref:tetratricopeptide repeat protein n=1 Tax=Hydrocurvibacter sulfurireducens TaxID=3131937 RepID=UPI0031F73B07
MAEENEEIIIIQDEDAAGGADFISDDVASEVKSDEKSEKQKKILLLGGAAAAVLVIGVVIFLLLRSSPDKTEIKAVHFIEKKLKEKPKKVIEQSQLEKIIAKANYLYTNGNKQEALNLYEQIALYSEAISQYNLGVAQLKDKQYKKALSTFKKAIKNNEKVCVSAINAAVCAHYLNQKESFRYYINLALAYLPKEINSPMYSYYYALIQYYKGNYLESLSGLEHPTSNEYKYQKQILKAKINSLFGNYYEAIDALENPFVEENSLTLGLLYSNIGDLTLAKKHLASSIPQNLYPVREELSLALINIKAGQLQEAAKQLNNLTDMYPQEVYIPYPVKVYLKDSLFDTEVAQTHFRKNMDNETWIKYEEIFYFAPYKVFNAANTISYIRKGNANMYIDDISSAKDYLEKSRSSSTVNYGIAQAIKKALSFRLRDANKQLEALVKIQPKHSILHYNLALTYAQMGDIQKAYEHFKRSYHLDSNNYLSGIFTIMCAQILHKQNDKFTSILKDNLSHEEPSEDTDLYTALLNITQNNLLGSSKWLNNTYQDRPLYLILNAIIASKLGKNDIVQRSAQKLSFLLPHDILPQIIYCNSKFKNDDSKEYAKETLFFMKKQNFNYEDLYFGPYITRYLYVQQALVTGTLYPLQLKLQEKLNTTKESPEEILYTLALTHLFSKDAEQAYTIFNQLIDDYKINDAHTLFLGAVASIAAGHHENAIALLELAKLKNPEYSESRFALGLLYLEQKNNKGAVIQLGHIQESGFQSNYFTFGIDTNELFFKKEHPDK